MDNALRNAIGAADTRPAILETEPARHLALDGHGAPDFFPAYLHSLRQIARAAELARSAPAEAQWWTVDGQAMTPDRVFAWRWTVLLKVPSSFGETQLARARGLARGHADAALLDRVALRAFHEGSVVQVLHIGPLRRKAPALRLMRDYARQRGFDLHGKYHEIYFDDPGPDAPPTARTLLRWPVVRDLFAV